MKHQISHRISADEFTIHTEGGTCLLVLTRDEAKRIALHLVELINEPFGSEAPPLPPQQEIENADATHVLVVGDESAGARGGVRNGDVRDDPRTSAEVVAPLPPPSLNNQLAMEPCVDRALPPPEAPNGMNVFDWLHAELCKIPIVMLAESEKGGSRLGMRREDVSKHFAQRCGWRRLVRPTWRKSDGRRHDDS